MSTTAHCSPFVASASQLALALFASRNSPHWPSFNVVFLLSLSPLDPVPEPSHEAKKKPVVKAAKAAKRDHLVIDYTRLKLCDDLEILSKIEMCKLSEVPTVTKPPTGKLKDVVDAARGGSKSKISASKSSNTAK